MTSNQFEKVKRFGQVAGLCALASYSLSKIASIPVVQHFTSLYANSLKDSFCPRPPEFDSISLFAKSLKASRTQSGFGEVAEMKAVEYHLITNSPLHIIEHPLPERFSIAGNLVRSGRTENGTYYFDLGDDKSPEIRILASEDLLPNFNLLGATGMHRAVLTFKQGSGLEKQGDIVRVSTRNGSFKMELDNARFEY